MFTGVLRITLHTEYHIKMQNFYVGEPLRNPRYMPDEVGSETMVCLTDAILRTGHCRIGDILA